MWINFLRMYFIDVVNILLYALPLLSPFACAVLFAQGPIKLTDQSYFPSYLCFHPKLTSWIIRPNVSRTFKI